MSAPSSLSPLHVLVTGGAGFIGSHVVRSLCAKGASVTVLDNLASGRLSNLEGIDGDVQFVQGDVRDRALVEMLLQGAFAVVHLAAEPFVPVSIREPLETHSINYVGTLTLLEAMRATNVMRIVYASSAAVYPQGIDHPVAETNATDPSSPYGMDKLFGDIALRTYRKLHGIRGTSLRFFNVYGERQLANSSYSGVISVFVDRITNGKPLTIYGDGGQCRDFIYAGDVANVVSSCALLEDSPALINVGTGQTISLLDLVSTLESITGNKVDVNHEPTRPGDVYYSCAAIDTLRSLGESVLPRTDLRDGLKALLGQ